MRMHPFKFAPLLCALLCAACASDDGMGETPGSDSGLAADSSAPSDDAGTMVERHDSGASAADAGGGTTDAGSTPGGLCPSPLPSAWVFCDDFETGDVASRYFEFGDNGGDFRRVSTEAVSGSHSMEVLWQVGEVGAGGMKVTFGRNPIGTRYRTSEDFQEIYWRMRVKHEAGWVGSPAKLSRATVFSGSDWSQAMIAHLWSAGDVLLGDPAGCVVGGTAVCQGYNDFSRLDWLGQMRGSTPIFSTADSGRWRCVEGRLKLNTPGNSDGVFEFWIDENLEASRTNFNWRGTYTDYGINAVFFENYWNSGSGREQRRWFDDIAIATVPIGCD